MKKKLQFHVSTPNWAHVISVFCLYIPDVNIRMLRLGYSELTRLTVYIKHMWSSVAAESVYLHSVVATTIPPFRLTVWIAA